MQSYLVQRKSTPICKDCSFEFTVQCTFNRVLNIKYNIFETLENIRYQDTTYSKYEKSKSEYYSSVLLVLPVQCPANFVEYQISKANYKI